jgi:hypothetical protein
MPIGTPEVDAAAGWSQAGVQMPSLGYSIPNAQLEALGKLGLGNTRAAQALRRFVAAGRQSAATIALENEKAAALSRDAATPIKLAAAIKNPPKGNKS